MSKYATVATEFKDPQCLIEALKEIGYTAVQLHEQAVNLYGYQGDKRSQTAEIVIPRNTQGGLGRSSNDLGFKKNSKGNYEALISEYDSGVLGANFLPRLKASYAKLNTKKTALIQGLRFIQETTNELGEVQLEFEVM